MLLHLSAMSIAAPLLAVLAARQWAEAPISARDLWLSVAINLACLAAFHVPPTQQAAAGSTLAQCAAAIALLSAATWFWTLFLIAGRERPWLSILPLLLTGKFVCLIGALLIFAPRDLYQLDGLVFALCAVGSSTREDQQMAGLVMIVACSLSYVAVAVASAARLLRWLERRSAFAEQALSAR